MGGWRVPRYDYPGQYPGLAGSLLPQIERLLLDGDYILGDAVSRFERDLADFLGAHAVVGVGSGTDALTLALDALGIGPGDEVITVANSFYSTASAVARVGATPVLVDCRADNYLIDLDAAAAAVGPRTKALLVVHLYGQAVDMAAAGELARRHGLLLVEDCAQAIGAHSGASRVGTDSDAGCWSFAPSKNLAAAGDGGAISLRDDRHSEQLRMLRHFGQAAQNDHRMLGYNSRLDSIQALVLAHKLPHLEDWNRQRSQVAHQYRTMLGDLPLRFQQCHDDKEHVYHLFQIETERRDQLMAHLRADGVDAVVRYPVPLHLQPAFQGVARTGQRPEVSERLAQQTLCLPLFPSITQEQIDLACGSVTRFFETAHGA
ncbi:DegT/DnrJ/EryC1/StrS family aminotransferase [Dactylosporangium matsuzakiense]|uniref:Erythromycin biosynthesis sensory transduction protein EryC1 n=1 Tax=Dactylosporangium matsuzakiense TaxID=53360 RepID=A0A9W6KJK2_9ACTN|nr:DegT/DnrJ/EryC1/StrS family aminotransferase [Dactylosporangium matsuzakiense]GLL02152.1 erythromycin biosynthesis sensory transduction protein EryC1 [Dactylosporangium matsuzakiense]